MNKRLLLFFAAFSLLLGMTSAFPLNSLASSGVKINKTTFPDTCFRKVVSSYDLDGDGFLSWTERKTVTELYVSFKNIGSLKGIERFTNLQILHCSYNHLKSLDLSMNVNLTDLDCSENDLTGLSISKNTKLESLCCSSNLLTKISVAKNKILRCLNCSGNQLKTLSLDNCPMLRVLFCEDNQLKELDLSENPELESLSCSRNQISELDIGQNPKLIKAYDNGCNDRGDVCQYIWTYSDIYGSLEISEINIDSCTILIGRKPAIEIQPDNQVCKAGDTASFSVDASGGGLVYQWQYRTSNSGSWTEVASASGKSSMYDLTARARHDGYQYRCKVSNAKGKVYSSIRTLLVSAKKPAIATQPLSKTVSEGEKAAFQVEASGGGLTYQWYFRTSASGIWTAVSAASGKTATYSLTAKARHNGYQYRCKVTNLKGSVYSGIVTLVVK